MTVLALVAAGVACFAAFALGWVKGYQQGMHRGGVLLAEVHTDLFQKVCAKGTTAEIENVRRFLEATRSEVVRRYGAN